MINIMHRNKINSVQKAQGKKMEADGDIEKDLKSFTIISCIIQM